MQIFNYSDTFDSADKFKHSSATIPTDCPSLCTILERASQGVPLNLCGKPKFDASEDAGEARVSSESVPLSEVRSNGINGDYNRKPKEASKKPSNKKDESEVGKDDDNGVKPAEEPNPTEIES